MSSSLYSSTKPHKSLQMSIIDFTRRSGPLILRMIVGYGFIWHGYAKLMRGPDTFAVVLHTLAVPFPTFFAWLTTLVELVGGAAILMGAFVTLASIPMAIILLVALFTVHLPYGFPSVRLAEVTVTGIKFGPAGFEIILLYLAGLASIVVGGAGPLSLDEWRARRSTGSKR